MTPKHHFICDLPSFGGGLLTAEVRSAHDHYNVTIKAVGPGSIHTYDLYAGPKEWSPHGFVPKDWQLLFRLDGGWAAYQMAYTNIEGHAVTVSITLCGKKKTSLYFVPM